MPVAARDVSYTGRAFIYEHRKVMVNSFYSFLFPPHFSFSSFPFA